MSYREQAAEKLKTEYKAGKYDRYAEIMKQGVRDTLLDFCGQNEEFAQAVVQGGSFEACMKAVAQNCGKGISDLEAYCRALSAEKHYPCRGHDCYDQGNFHVGCEGCPLYGEAEAATAGGDGDE